MSFRPLTGNHLVNHIFMGALGKSFSGCFRPLTGNHLVNLNEYMNEEQEEKVSVPLRGII